MPFFFSAPCKAEIIFPEDRKVIEIETDEKVQEVPQYFSTEAVTGTAKIQLTSSNKKIEHRGISIALIGAIETFHDRGEHFEFTSISRELAPAGFVTEDLEFAFDFSDVEKQYESYTGINVRLRYFVKIFMDIKNSLSDCICVRDIWVKVIQPVPEINSSLKMEVGIEDTLHIEFEYQHAKYDLKGIKHMEINLIQRENAGTGPSLFNENKTLLKYEIMEGAPVKGESVPVRLFLGGVDLTPTYKNVASKFSLKYYLNLVLVDQDDRRYFKQQEITLYRSE